MRDIDEAEIFKGAENTLEMEQTYTHAFQCVFKLAKYPFDTQVHVLLTLLGPAYLSISKYKGGGGGHIVPP